MAIRSCLEDVPRLSDRIEKAEQQRSSGDAGALEPRVQALEAAQSSIAALELDSRVDGVEADVRSLLEVCVCVLMYVL